MATDDTERAAIIHREFLQLGALVAIAVALFFVTRALAANNHGVSLRDADEWYRRGQQAVAAGRLNDGIDALRRATVRNRTDKTYVLALASALALNGSGEAARGVLLALRDAAPEDADVNLELARLAAGRQDVTEAPRFYHSALYAPWPPELAETRRGVRLELTQFLLAHNQAGRAVAELLAASADLPDRPEAHVRVALLFARAGDDEHALSQFQQVLRAAPADAQALAGAGRSAFRLRRYSLALSYLRRAPAEVDGVARLREIAELVMSRDPLANRIGSPERRRRLNADFAYARERAAACGSRPRTDGAPTSDAGLVAETAEFERRLRGPAVLEEDTIDEGVELVSRLARQLATACGSTTPLDEALALIGREHGGDTR